MRSLLQHIKQKMNGIFNVIFFLLPILLITLAFNRVNNEKLLFENEKSIRSSFCLYSDGRFYDAQASGCIGQSFAWGNWKNINDTMLLNYSKENIFYYDIQKSIDSLNHFQIVRILDRYNQPVRFQIINRDSGYTNLFNTGILKIKKGNSINYPAPTFDNKDFEYDYILSNADTITYKWHCNRECIESISGGHLDINNKEITEKVILKNKRIERLN